MATPILITGASGQQGRAVARALLAQGASVRAMSRKPEKLASLKEHGAELVAGDLTDPQSIERALHGVKQAYLVTTPYEMNAHAETEQGIAFVDAATKAGVEHIVFASVCSANQNTGIPHFDSKRPIENHIRQSGMTYTILRPVFFMENFGSPWFFPALESGVLSWPIPESRTLEMVSLDVIGNFGAAAFLRREAFANQEIDIASDEVVIADIVAMISKASGKSIAYEEMPDSQAAEVFGEDFAKMFLWFKEVGFSVDLKALANFGIPLTSFRDYLAQAPWVKRLAPLPA